MSECIGAMFWTLQLTGVWEGGSLLVSMATSSTQSLKSENELEPHGK